MLKLLNKGSYFIIIIFMAVSLLTGCQSQEITVQIEDQNVLTKLITSSGNTVKDLLEEAEITINHDDKVTPSLDSKINNDSKISILRHVDIKMNYDHKMIDVEYYGGIVQDILDKANIKLKKNDFIDYNVDDYLVDGMVISIIPRLAVDVKVDGKNHHILTAASTIKELLSKENISYSKDDRITPKLSKQLTEGMKIVIKRVTYKEVTQTEIINYATTVQYSKKMNSGQSKIIKKGSNGKKKVTYKITYVDGKEESRKVIKEVILQKATNQIVLKGTKKGKYIVSKERIEDCDGSGHGYYVITYSDGTVEYVDF